VKGKEPAGWVYEVPLEAICREVCRAMGIEEDKLYSATKGREGARGRAVVGYLARRAGGHTVKETGEYFRRSAVAIGEGIMKVEELIRRDKSFVEGLKRMEDKVIKEKEIPCFRGLTP